MLINMRNGLMAGKRLPYDAEVEYLESTGTQWIDTGVKLKTPCVVESTFIPIADNFADRMPLGVTSGGNTRLCPMSILNGYFIAKSPDGMNYNLTTCQSGLEYSARVSFGSRFVFRINNVSRTVWGGNITSKYNLLVFANNWNGTVRLPSGAGLTGKIKRLYIENGDGAMRDFLLVRFTNELGQTEGAMYDRANPTVGMNPDGSARTDGLYRNRGTDAFLYGNDI